MNTTIRRLLILAVALSIPRTAGAHVTRIAFSPGGTEVAACWGRNVTVFAMADGRRVAHFATPRSATGVAFAPDGRRLAVGMLGQSIFLYDLASRRVLRKMHQGGSTAAGGYSLTFAAAATLITQGAPSDRQVFDRSVRFWSLRTGRIRASVGRSSAVQLGAGRRLAALTQEPSAVIIVDASTGRVTRRIAGAWLPDGGVDRRARLVAYVDDRRGQVMRLDLASGSARRLALAKGGTSAAVTHGFHHVAIDDDKMMRVYSLPAGRLEARFAAASPRRIGAGEGLVAAEEDWTGRIHVWRAATGRPLATIPSGDYTGGAGHDDSQWTFDPAGRRLVILDDKMLGRWGREALRVADAATGRVLWTKPTGGGSTGSGATPRVASTPPGLRATGTNARG